MKPVTDPALIQQLESQAGGKPVTDPKLIESLNAQADQSAPKDQSLLDQAESIGASFTGGVMDLVGLPADLINIPLRAMGAPTIPSGGQDLRALASNAGLTHAPGTEPDDFAHRASRIAGSSILPSMGLMGRGAQLASRQMAQMAPIATKAAPRLGTAHLPQGSVGLLDEIGAGLAARPAAAVGAESASVLGAAAGGQSAANVFPDSPAAEVAGELVGGFTPAALTSLPMASKTAWRGLKAGAFPFTPAGGQIRGARRIQGLAADPEQAASRVAGDDTLPEAKLSPARRTGDKRLLALEQAVAKDDPELDARLTEQLSQANRTAREAANLGGDQNVARETLERRRASTVARVDQSAEQAAAEAEDALSRFDIGDSPRDMSRAAREKVQSALNAQRAEETRLWNEVESDAPSSVTNAQQRLGDELEGRGRFADPDDVPEWLIRSLGEPGEGLTFKDVHDLRKRVGVEIAKERAQTAPNRNKVRILSDTYDALLDDMAASAGQGPAVQKALDFSRQLNQRFRQGSIGRLLGFERRGGRAVADEDTLRRVVTGDGSGVKVRELLEAAPEARKDLTDYLRAEFYAQAVDNGRLNARAAKAFQRKHAGALEQLPELRTELGDVRETSRQALRMAGRQKRVAAAARNAKKSRASLYLDGQADQEWDRVLRSDRPAVAALALRRQMGDDAVAVQGLKSSFVDELMRRAETRNFDEAGEAFVSGSRLRAELAENDAVMRSLGMSKAERDRLEKVANTLARVEASPGAPQKIIDDLPNTIMELFARLIGAHTGQKIASGGTGASLVMAQAFSKRMVNTLRRLTSDKAKQILSAAVDDPELFRDLLVSPTDKAKRQAQVAQRLNAWLGAPAAEVSQGPESEPIRLPAITVRPE